MNPGRTRKHNPVVSNRVKNPASQAASRACLASRSCQIVSKILPRKLPRTPASQTARVKSCQKNIPRCDLDGPLFCRERFALGAKTWHAKCFAIQKHPNQAPRGTSPGPTTNLACTLAGPLALGRPYSRQIVSTNFGLARPLVSSRVKNLASPAHSCQIVSRKPGSHARSCQIVSKIQASPYLAWATPRSSGSSLNLVFAFGCGPARR